MLAGGGEVLLLAGAVDHQLALGLGRGHQLRHGISGGGGLIAVRRLLAVGLVIGGPYNVVAAEGLLEAYDAANASHLLDAQYRDADGYWYGIYKGILGFMVNKDELARMNLEAPQDWQDLLKEENKDLIWLCRWRESPARCSHSRCPRSG